MIALENVTCRYEGRNRGDDESEADEHGADGGIVAVDDVTLSIPDGEFLVVAGANGSGKTTLVRTFNGLVRPESGTVSVNGVPVEEDLVAARAAIGMVFQDPRDQLVAATVGGDVAFGPENLGLSHAEIDRRVAAALDAVDMAGREGDRIATLSGGERERVAIAGALAMEPDHLVCDEPFAGLDEPARESVLARLRDLHTAGTGVVVVTHDLRDVLESADRVVGLADGRVVVDGPPDAAVPDLAGLGVRIPETFDAPAGDAGGATDP
ncbi:energy-coupling factor ABC transporter ATP-binding protein [Halorubrum aethiopicum]|uniref:energy-coupling factor ABC transporter ATP-binding protein n=1 Tax=Halorubrum aethiopicum TaxID=1758255 RepID=UPI00082B70BB|nr:ABC transporter ATP-binding protein [Halorubrum aethiopicum]